MVVVATFDGAKHVQGAKSRLQEVMSQSLQRRLFWLDGIVTWTAPVVGVMSRQERDEPLHVLRLSIVHDVDVEGCNRGPLGHRCQAADKDEADVCRGQFT